MHFTNLMQILKQTSYLFVAFISIIPCISVSISEAHTDIDTENDMYYNKSIDSVEDEDKKYIPFLYLETILSTLIQYREYIVIAWFMCLPIVIYNLSREDWVKKYVRLVKSYLMTLVNWFFHLFHFERDDIRDDRINQNDQDTRDYEREFIKLCQIQYYLILTVEELEEKTREYYRRDLPEFIGILSLSVRSLEMMEERIHENRNVRSASCPPHNILGPGLRLSQISGASRSRNMMESLAHLRIPEQEQGRPLPEVISEILDRLHHICQNFGLDLSR